MRKPEWSLFIASLLWLFSISSISAFAITSNAITSKTPTCSTSECHSQIRSFKFLHKPLNVDSCIVCHNPSDDSLPLHLPKNHPRMESISKKEINSLCTTCHDDKKSAGYKSVHKPISDKSCTECHNPHGSSHPRLLKFDTTQELCISCHKDKKDKPHIASHEKTSCLTCHANHFSHESKLLKSKMPGLCFQCHKNAMTRKNAEEFTPIIPNMQLLLESSKSSHRPFSEGKCTECHEPHGSEVNHFLKKSYSKTDFSLCLGCHKEQKFNTPTISTTDSTADNYTDFRNGDLNLHYRHMHRGGKTMGCLSCHDVHASSQAKLIRSFLKFTSWNAQILYQKMATGGTCMAACHNEKKYDRINKVNNPSGR